MASLLTREESEERNVEESDHNTLLSMEGKSDVREVYNEDDPSDMSFSLNKDDSGIALDSFLLSKSQSDEVKSPTISLTDAELNEVEWLNESEVPSAALMEPGNEMKHETQLTETHSFTMKSEEDIEDERQGKICHEIDVNIDKTSLHSASAEIETKSPTGNVVQVTSSCLDMGRSNSACDKESEEESPTYTHQSMEVQDGQVNEETDLCQKQELQAISGSSDDDDGGGDKDSSSLTTLDKQTSHHRYGSIRNKVEGGEKSSSTASDDTADDDDDDGGGGHEEMKNKYEEKESDIEVEKVVLEILNKPTPKPNWFAVPELRKREYGYITYHNYNSFREHVHGSLEMVKRLVVVDSMKGHEGCVNTLSFNRTGTLLASGSDDLKIILWNWQGSRASLVYDSGHRSNVFQVRFMPYSGDCHVISCARDGQVRLAELSLTGVCKATRKLAQHRGAAHKLALEDSPNVFLSCGEDAVTYLFDLREERPHKLVTTKESDKKVPLYSIHSNPCDCQEFCVGGRDHYIRVYDKRKIAGGIDGGVVKKFCPDHLINSDLKANVTCASYNYNGTEILGTYNDEDIYLFDSTMSGGANFVRKYSGHRNNATVKGVSFYGPKSEFIVSGSDCSYVYFWDKETEAIVNFQKGDEAGVINVLEPHPNLPVLTTSGLDHDVKLWMPSPHMPIIDTDLLTETLKKNHKERNLERESSEPEMIGGQMLWFIMQHFRNSARRRMREEGQVLSSSEDDSDSLSDDAETNEMMQCAQS